MMVSPSTSVLTDLKNGLAAILGLCIAPSGAALKGCIPWHHGVDLAGACASQPRPEQAQQLRIAAGSAQTMKSPVHASRTKMSSTKCADWARFL